MLVRITEYPPAWLVVTAGSGSAEFVAEAIAIVKEKPVIARYLGLIAGESHGLGVASEIADLIRQAPSGIWSEAALAEATGDFERSAQLYESMGAPTLAAEVRFSAAEKLLADGRLDESIEQLEQALVFYRSVGATFFLERGERLRAEAQRASA